MRKYYLSIEHRKFLVEILLEKKQAINNQVKKDNPSPSCLELCEEAIQECDMLYKLFKVEDCEL